MGEENQPVSIVVIDDNPANLEFVAEALARSGAQILTSEEPEKGLALVAAHHPRVVLTDVIMPGMSGLDVLREAKLLDRYVDVVLMSADDLPQERAEDTGMAAAYLRKPISPAKLRDCVARLLEKHDVNSNDSHG
jgi:two-component system, NtrC family, response regulator HydG